MWLLLLFFFHSVKDEIINSVKNCTTLKLVPTINTTDCSLIYKTCFPYFSIERFFCLEHITSVLLQSFYFQ